MILVTGATGNVGSELVRTIDIAGQPVRALSRRIPRTAAPGNVEFVAGDLNDPSSLAPAFRGVKSLFLLPGYPNTSSLLAEAQRVGVEHVVLLSGPSAGSGDTTNAITRYMVDSERAVRASGLSWTIVRPSGFMSNTLQWIPQLTKGDEVRAPFANVPIAVIDPYDIAAVAATALIEEGHAGHVLRVTGPEALLPSQRLETLAAVLHRDLRFEAQPHDEARAEMLEDTPPEYVDAFFDFYENGSLDDSQVLPTVLDVTGRAARKFENWAESHAAAFR